LSPLWRRPADSVDPWLAARLQRSILVDHDRAAGGDDHRNAIAIATPTTITMMIRIAIGITLIAMLGGSGPSSRDRSLLAGLQHGGYKEADQGHAKSLIRLLSL